MNFTVLMIDHVVLYVADVATSEHFYCEVLGCEVVRRNPAANLTHLSAGRSLIDLLPRPDGAAGANVDHVALQISPFEPDALVAHLRGHGVEPTEVRDRFGAGGTGPSLTFTDPDGNTIELKGPAYVS